MSHHRFPLRSFQSRQSSQSYCLFIYFGLFWDLLRHGCKEKKEGEKRKIERKGEGYDKTWSKTVIQRCSWYGQTHTQAISLITSDREGAKGNSYSHGHFHCGAPLAICPIYAFSTHMNTYTHTKHVCIYKYTLSQINLFTYTHQCAEKRKKKPTAECTHKHKHVYMDAEVYMQTLLNSRDTYRGNEITRLVVL